MRRRKFLSWLGTAAALPAFAPLAKLFSRKVDPRIALIWNWNGTQCATVTAFSMKTGMALHEAKDYVTNRAKSLGYDVQIIDDVIYAVPL